MTSYYYYSHLCRSTRRSVSATHPRRWSSAVSSIPTFRAQIACVAEPPSFSERVKCPSVKNQVLLFGFGSFLVFFLAADITNEETYEWSVRLGRSAQAWKRRPPTNDEMRRARYYSLGKALQQRLAHLREVIQEWPQTLQAMVIWSYIQVAQPILDTSESKRWCWAIGALNGVMYFAWHFPRLKTVIRTRYTHNPLSGLSYTMFTSLFSHRSILHVVANSMALAAFGSATAQYFFQQQSKNPDNLREATPKWHFLAFFVSAGLFSNLVSHAAFSRITFPRMVRRLKTLPPIPPPSTTKRSLLARFFRVENPKLKPFSNPTERLPLGMGTSGAVYATITLAALAFPDTELAMKIPPTFPLPITLVVESLLAMDIIGVWRGWMMFNHWAHLGGAAFGAFYWAYGPHIWELLRELALGDLPPTLSILPETSDVVG